MLFTDIIFASKYKYTKGNKCFKLFASHNGYLSVFPMKSQDEFETYLHWFCKDVSTLVDLISDKFSTQTKSYVNLIRDQVGTVLKML